jgi:hypothetical protein
MAEPDYPRVFHTLRGDAMTVRDSPTGRVGQLFSGAGLEAVWVRKEGEAIDPEWFAQPIVDLLVVVQGQLYVEFPEVGRASMVLGPGDVLVLPPGARCRAYRWPRDRQEATVFVAVYPTELRTAAAADACVSEGRDRGHGGQG